MSRLTKFDKEAASLKKELQGFADNRKENKEVDAEKESAAKLNLKSQLESGMKQLAALRAGDSVQQIPGMDVTADEFVKAKWGFENVAELMRYAGGVDIRKATVHSLTSMGDINEDFRWLVPELFVSAIRAGQLDTAVYRSLIAESINIPGTSIKVPVIDRSDARATKIGESETIPTGAMSFNQKEAGTQKIGVGLKVSDEVLQYVPMNLLSIFFADAGNQMDLAQDNMLVDILINGDGNGNAAPVIGVQTTSTLAYVDLLRAWLRMGQISRMPQVILANETPALDTLTIDQFNRTDYLMPGIDNKQVNLRSPIPRVQDLLVTGSMPTTNQIMLVDRTKAAIRIVSKPLAVESERIVNRQVNGTYATMTLGFANLFTDGRLIIDKSLAFATNGFPAYMDYSTLIKAMTFRS